MLTDDDLSQLDYTQDDLGLNNINEWFQTQTQNEKTQYLGL